MIPEVEAFEQLLANFNAQAKARAAEMLAMSSSNERLQAAREFAFCLGYKAGVVDFGSMLREQYGADFAQIIAVFEAACVWRDQSRADRNPGVRRGGP